MCGRYVTPDEAEIERAWRIGPRRPPLSFEARYNVAPTTQVPILHRSPDAYDLVLELARWGLIPHWWSQEKPPKLTHNARVETAALPRSMWTSPLKISRCLVPARGWYESRPVPLADPDTGELSIAKQPHFIYDPGKPLLAFAGLRSTWKASPDAPIITTCTIMTTDAAASIADVHDRMPVALPASAHDAWLDPTMVDGSQALAIVREHALQHFEHHPVSRRPSTRGADGADLLNPI